MKNLIDYKLFTTEEKMRLLDRVYGDSSAEIADFDSLFLMLENIVEFNVIKLSPLTCGSFDEDDLRQQAWCIVYEELDKFEHSKGSFDSFIIFRLQRRLDDYAKKGRFGLAISQDDRRLLSKISINKSKYEKEFGCEPEIEELASMCNQSVEKIANCLKANEVSSNVWSLNSKRGDSDVELGELIKDSRRFEEIIQRVYDTEWLVRTIDNTLNKTEALAVKYRHGLLDNEMHTLEEVKDVIGVNNKQRAGQILNMAERKLKRVLEGPAGNIAA